jgi:hypothetical protein
VGVCVRVLDAGEGVLYSTHTAHTHTHTHITQWQPAYTQESIQVKHVVGVSNSSTARTLVRLKKSNFFLKKKSWMFFGGQAESGTLGVEVEDISGEVRKRARSDGGSSIAGEPTGASVTGE